MLSHDAFRVPFPLGLLAINRFEYDFFKPHCSYILPAKNFMGRKLAAHIRILSLESKILADKGMNAK
jgi:hypothetical protein